ncbi:MAG TPA: glycosyltransferase [Propionibacteriaceae bacterium]
MSTSPPQPRVLVAIPAYGSAELTDTVLSDLLRDDPDLLPDARIVVVDNAGDYEPPPSVRVTRHRSGANLRWIGSANWALKTAQDEGFDVCAVLNNDTRLSPGFLAALVAPFAERPDAAIVAACYDDFWLHQRASVIPETAAAYEPVDAIREVPFCDGTAIAFSVPVVAQIGSLDTEAFPRHGYGSDIDLALRARTAGFSCLVTEGAYVSHLRRATMNRLGETSEANRAEILDGMNAKWGEGWRARAGLSPDAFPPHNTGSGASWYL